MAARAQDLVSQISDWQCRCVVEDIVSILYGTEDGLSLDKEWDVDMLESIADSMHNLVQALKRQQQQLK